MLVNMRSQRQQVTSFEVARLAGVSQPTVSRALRNLPGASPETRARVMAAARELSYIPSASGRVLSTSRTRRVAVVVEELTNPYYPQLVEPLRRELAEHGLRMVLVAHTERGPVGVAELADGSYDGAILTTTERRSSLPRDLTERGIPHVLANRVLDVPESPGVSLDNIDGIRQVVDLLVGLGHRDLASIQGPTITSTGHERAQALLAAVHGHGLALPRERIRRVAFDHDAGMGAALSLLDSPQPPTALICGNDVIALGALSAARQRGVDVPRDVTVIGFDDIGPSAWPLADLTTVHADLDALARTAVSLLLAQIDGDAHGTMTVQRIPVKLVPRATHAPARASLSEDLSGPGSELAHGLNPRREGGRWKGRWGSLMPESFDYDKDLWADVSHETSRRLLLAAVESFAAQGYNATTTRQIAQRAGMSPAAVYMRYPSKQALLFEISRTGHTAVLRDVQDAVEGALSPRERLWRFMHVFVSWHAHNHTVARINQYELVSLGDEQFREIRKLRDQFGQALMTELRNGVQSGDFVIADLDVTSLALLSLGIDVARWYTGRGKRPDELGRAYADLAMKLVDAQGTD
jgi:LacI family transcriptional regulator